MNCALRILAVMAFSSSCCAGQNIPAINTKALDGSQVTLPKEGSQQTSILILGFSRKGGDMGGEWRKKISAEFRGNGQVTYYSLVMLQDAPSIMRPLILHGIRKGLSTEEMAHFLPLYANEEEWKKAVQYSSPDDAYIVVVDGSGKMVWLAHGAYTESGNSELQKAVSAKNETQAGKR